MAKFRALTLPQGWIEVICGPMFAGKSEELIKKLNRLIYADVEYVIFKPIVDSRSENEIKSRSGLTKDAVNISNSYEILNYLMESKNRYKVIAIDEAQFFDNDLVDVCDTLANNGYVVLVAGLDRDFRGEPFGPIPVLLTKAEIIHKLTAICTECGAPATMTQRIIDNKPAHYQVDQFLIGNHNDYLPRCRHCHKVSGKKVNEIEKKFIRFTSELKN